MFKNVASKFIVFAFDATTNVPKTGDAANITCYVSKDYGAVTVLADTSATEMDATNAPGYYLVDAAQGETNGDVLLVSGKSSTANIKVIGAPAVIYTRPTTGWLAPATAGRTLNVDASGRALSDLDTIKTQTITCAAGVTVLASVGTAATSTAQTGDSYAIVNGASGLVAIKTQTAAIEVDTADIQSRLPAALTADGNIKADTLRVGGTLQTAGDLKVLIDAKASQASLDTVDGIVDNILLDTAELQTDWANGGRLDLILDARASQASVDDVPTVAEFEARTLVSASYATASALGDVPTNAELTTALDSLPTLVELQTELAALPTANENADALLLRNINGGSSTGRVVREALAFLRNRWSLSLGTLTVYDTDDTTTLWTGSYTTDGAAEPIVSINPA